MIDTILFDLDGTLLAMDTQEFIEGYFKALSIKLAEYVDPEILTKIIWSATLAMIENVDKNKTNQDVFYHVFFNQIDVSEKILEPVFDDFYKNDFKKLNKGIQIENFMMKSVELLKEKGYDLIVATNPLFPKEAVEERIKWAGLKQEDFSFYTSYEDMHACKPQIEYYQEVLEKTNKKPSQTMMVGNDVKEDMIVKDLGIQTYLIEDHIIGKLGNKEQIDYHGNYEDFYKFCLNLPCV